MIKKRRELTRDSKGAIERLHLRSGFMLRRAVQRSTSTFAEHCKPITTTQFGMMVILWEKEGLSQKEIGDLLFLDRTTTALAVRILEEKGMVARHRHPRDKRKMVLSLTDTAKDAMPDLTRRSLEAQDILLANLDDAERATLNQLLRKLIGYPMPNGAASVTARQEAQSD